MTGASTRDQLGRLLTLAPYLQTRGAVPLAEVAADFGVSREQILRDLRVLYMCGLPGFGPADLIDINVESLLEDPDGLVRIDNAEFLARPLRLGSNEASALIVALRALLDSSVETSREVVERTLAKLEAATEAGSTPLVDVRLHAQGPDLAQTLRALSRAIAEDRQARISYLVPSRDERTERVVDPIAVLQRDGKSYLDAWCHLADDRRLFRIDRITGTEVLGTAREVPDLAPRDLGEGLFAAGPDDLVVRVRLSPDMRWFSEYYPVLGVETAPDGSQDVTLAVSDERWLLRLAMRFGRGLTICEPTSLGERLATLAAAALRLQRDTA